MFLTANRIDMLKLLSTLGFLLVSLLSTAQEEPVSVIETSIVLDFDRTKELFFSLAEGDQLIINMEMIKGKNLKEFAIFESSGNPLLTEFKVSNIKDKKVYIPQKGVYMLRFYNSALTRRVCKINMKRIPISDTTRNFNTNWQWGVKRDTVYTNYTVDSLIDYKIIDYEEVVRELKERKFEEMLLLNKSQKVHSFYNSNLSRTYLKVTLPQLQNSDFQKERIVAWSYWIGVDNEGYKAYQESVKSVSKMIKDVAGMYTTPLGGLAVGAITQMIIPKTGHDVEYYFIEDSYNTELFLNRKMFSSFDMGKGKAAYGRNDMKKQGTFYIGLANDNNWIGIEVEVKILVVKEIQIFEDILYKKQRKEPQYITLNKTKMNVYESRIRVPIE